MHRLTIFFRFWTWFSFRQLRDHFWRTMAVLVGIGLGAAVFTSVRLAVDASLDSFTRSVDALSGKSDWTVLCPGGRVPESLISNLIRHPAVQALSPLSTIYVETDNATAGPILLIGLDPILDRSLRTWEPEPSMLICSQLRPIPTSDIRNPAKSRKLLNVWLDLIREPFTLIAGERLYARLHLQTGQRSDPCPSPGEEILSGAGQTCAAGPGVSRRWRDSPDRPCHVSGIYGNVWLRRPHRPRTQALGPADAADRIRTLLPAGVTLEPPAELKESGRLMVRSYQLNLSVLSFVSLFVGMFLVYSLISLHATSRRHELAILRSLGASSRLIFLLFLSEGAFFGCVGWLLAIPLGSFMVKHLLAHVSTTISHLFIRVQVDRLLLDPWEILLSFAPPFSCRSLQPGSRPMKPCGWPLARYCKRASSAVKHGALREISRCAVCC